jgi:tetratricopeptide (TPR) repeat protein
LIGLLSILIVLAIAGWIGGRYFFANQERHAAEQALARYDFPQALKGFEAYLKLWPNDDPTRFQAARAARRAGLFARAGELLAEYEKHQGITVESALERAMERAQRGDLVEVEGSLQRLIIEGHPDAVLMLEALAQGYLAVYRLGFAIASIHMLLERDPNHPDAHFWRGGILEGSGRSQDALADYEQAVQFAPQKNEYQLRLAEALVRNRKPAEARPHFDELLRKMPGDPGVLLGTARCLRALALPEQAVEHLDTLLSQHPDHAEGWAERGRLAAEQSDIPEALRCLRRAVELEPRSYAIGYSLLTVLRSQGQSQEASTLAEKLERMKQDEERLREISNLLSKNPNNPALRNEAGLICERNGVDEEALRWFLGALQDDPTHRPTHASLSEFYQRKGDTEKANYHQECAR